MNSFPLDLLPFVITGLATGSIYAVASLGLVLTYKTTGIFNFAHGSIAAVSAYVFYDLWKTHGVPWPLAIVLVVGVLAPLLGLALERLARRLVRVSTALKIVATVGLLVGTQGLLTDVYGSVSLPAPSFLPTKTYQVGSVFVSIEQLITMALALASAAGLAVVFRRTRTGHAMRAVVDNPDLLGLTGISPVRVRVTSWVIGSSFAALSGVLIAPSLGLNALLLAFLVIQAFGAAAIGGFGNLPLTYVGGLVIGIGADISKKYVGSFPKLSGFPPSFPFIVLFVVLLATPARRLIQAPDAPARPARPSAPVPLRASLGLGGLGIGALLLLPFVLSSRLPTLDHGLAYVLVFASLALLIRTSGQVSLCHFAFAAVGASSFAHLSAHGVPWIISLLAAGLITVPVGALVAIPAIRLTRLFLALATLGFGLLVERLLYTTPYLFGSMGTLQVSRPSFASGDRAYYYLSLAVVLAGLAMVQTVNRARLGRLLRAMSDSPTGLSTLGVNVNLARLLVLCVSAFLAGIAGALLAGADTSISTIGFNSFLSLTLIPVLFLAGRSQVTGPFIAAAVLVVLPSFFSGPTFVQLQPILFGMSAVGIAAVSGGTGDGRFIHRLAEQGRARMTHSILAERRAKLAVRRA